ncbi:U3 small nucleolar RNA-associated protein 8 [Lipomyces arxii]|uniref:U3 small nucleolar RNA-associated protein 8 n=1 Tax=Lipomyces arxii TaxID=56418 RepID=UPI0034CEF690
MTSILQPFTVHTLGSASSSPFFVSSPRSSIIDVAVSAAGISRLSIRPTPRLVSSIAISPLSEAQCAPFIVKGQDEQLTAFCVFRERKRNIFLRRLHEDGTFVETALAGEVSSLYVLSDNVVLVLFKSGQLTAYELHVSESEASFFQKIWTTFLYSSPDCQIITSNISKAVDEGNVLTLVTVARVQKLVIELRKVTVRFSGISLVNDWSLQVSESPNVHYHESGAVLQLTGSILEVITLPTTARSTLDLSTLLLSEDCNYGFKASDFTLIPVGKSTIMLSTGSQLHLINWKFSTIMTSLTLNENDNFKLVRRAGKRSALGVTANGLLQLVNFSIGSGKLSECITGNVKALSNAKDGQTLANIFFKSTSTSKEYRQEARTAFAASKSVHQDILQKISLIKEYNDSDSFDQQVIDYLTGKLETIEYKAPNKNSEKSSPKKPSNLGNLKQAKNIVYNPATARPVDGALISEIVNVMFETEVINGISTHKLSAFAPERTLGYLLTHPLFPPVLAPHILEILSSNLQLQKVAIRHTHGLTVESLTKTLVLMLSREDLSKTEQIAAVNQTVARLQKNFTYREITQSLSDTQNNAALQSSIVFLLSIVNTAEIGHSEAWNILPCFIDACGMFFLQHDVIEDMKRLVDLEIESLMGNMEAVELVDTVLEWTSKRKARSQKGHL